ncbi:MAG: hypothetical protein ABIR06_09475 [Cyclobacteriaceae bacterium]
MKTIMFFLFLVVLTAFSCSDDNEVKRKGDADVTHEGVKWNITSIETYALSDVSTTGVISKTGNLTNAGSFYFVDGGTKGSFEMMVEGYNKEDVFNYTNDAGSINIINVEQNVGASTNLNILVISGDKLSDTEMTLDAVSIVKQSTAGIFSLTAAKITLVKSN